MYFKILHHDSDQRGTKIWAFLLLLLLPCPVSHSHFWGSPTFVFNDKIKEPHSRHMNWGKEDARYRGERDDQAGMNLKDYMLGFVNRPWRKEESGQTWLTAVRWFNIQALCDVWGLEKMLRCRDNFCVCWWLSEVSTRRNHRTLLPRLLSRLKFHVLTFTRIAETSLFAKDQTWQQPQHDASPRSHIGFWRW